MKLLERTPGLEIIDHSVLTRPKKLVSNYNEEDVDVSDPKNLTTVGLSDQLELVKYKLLDGRPGIKTIALVGMAGIGKTHLSLQVYQDPVIVQKFKFRAWVRLCQKDRISNALADIVARIRRQPINWYIKMSTSQLHEILQRSLHDESFLIVLDDVWNREMYSALIQEFPRNVKEIWILLTTRLEELAKTKSSNIHRMCFLDSEESWNLLRLNVFPSTSLSPQLEKVGRKIAEKCEGLPLLILAIVKILSRSEKTEEYWNMVANNKTTTFPDAYDQISKVLYSSYNDFPQYLKFCFLYMGVFPQRCEIPLRKLVNLWSVEDFFEYQGFLLEGFSMECVKNIVSNSLAIVCNYSSNFTIKSFRLHSAYWHLCVKEARKNTFFHVIKDLTNTSMEDTVGQRRFSIQNNVLLGMKAVYESMTAASTSRSLLCTGQNHQYPVPICFDFLFLKVLDALAIRFYDFPKQLLKLVHLRYLGLTHNGVVPCSISNLRQLEYLILRKHHKIKGVRDSSCLPKEIWDMKELRHLWIVGSRLPHPNQGTTKLRELSTLHVNADSCAEAVFLSIPNLKKLGIKIELHPDTFETVSCF